MKNRLPKLPFGLRTAKTAAAVILSMLIVDRLGATPSKIIFSMLGVMAAMQPTFRDSLESSLTQIVGVLLGAAIGVLLHSLPLPLLVSAGLGIIGVITVYNACRIRFSPGLACLIVVTICSTEGIRPLHYAATRIWDTAIGIAVGMAVNVLIFPYDNSSRIRSLVESLDRELIEFLEDMFDGDTHMPDPGEMSRTIATLGSQLKIFQNQKLVLRLSRQKAELEQYLCCQRKARELLARMEVLSLMEYPGRLSRENWQILTQCGAAIPDPGANPTPEERDVVTNYHVRQILHIRSELLDILSGETREEDYAL